MEFADLVPEETNRDDSSQYVPKFLFVDVEEIRLKNEGEKS